MKLITDTGITIDISSIKIIEAKPGERLVYKIIGPTPPQQILENMMNALSHIFGKEVPIIVIGNNEEFILIKDEELKTKWRKQEDESNKSTE